MFKSKMKYVWGWWVWWTCKIFMYMMLYFDDLSWFMLEMSLNDKMIKYIPWNPCIYVRSMIFVKYSMMNTWLCWWTPTVHVWFMMIWMYYVEVLWWFLKNVKIDDDSCLELMNRTCNLISMLLIMLNAMLSIMLGMLTC